LVPRIHGAWKAGRPVWYLGNTTVAAVRDNPIVVPRMQIHLVPQTGGYKWISAPVYPADGVLKPRLELYLEAASDPGSDHVAARLRDTLQPHDITQWQKLAVAALHDIHNLDQAAVSAHIRLAERKTHDAVREGRTLLRQLSAWPWCCFTDAQLRASGWSRNWHRGPSRRTVAEFVLWETQKLHCI
jgi:hypothetical protein